MVSGARIVARSHGAVLVEGVSGPRLSHISLHLVTSSSIQTLLAMLWTRCVTSGLESVRAMNPLSERAFSKTYPWHAF